MDRYRGGGLNRWIPEQTELTALWPTRRTRIRCQTRPLRRFLKTKRTIVDRYARWPGIV